MRKLVLKKLSLALFALMVPLSALWPQTTNLEYNFDDGQVVFTPINANAAVPSYVLSVVDGVLNIQTTKPEQDWSFLGRFGTNVNISTLPTLQFRVKSSEDLATFAVRLKSPPKSDPEGELVQIEYTTSLVGGADFIPIFVNLETLIAANADFDPALITELQLDVSNGWFETTNTIVYLDDFKIGFPEPLETGGTGYLETFDGSELPEGAISNNSYTLSLDSDAMTVDVSRSNRWYAFDYELGQVYDFSENPYLNLMVRTDQDMVIQAFLVDESGKGYAVQEVGSQFVYHELVANSNEFRQARVYTGESYVPVGFDFTGYNTAIVDLSKIVKVKFVVNGTGLSFDGSFSIDELRIGSEAFRLANIGQVPDWATLKNTPGNHKILVPELSNVASLTLSGAEALISNIVVEPISYTNTTENGIARTYGYTNITFDLVPDAVGDEIVTLMATGAAGFEDNEMSFNLMVSDNNQPTITALPALVIKVGETATIDFTNVTDGDPSAEQSITITATSSNTTVADNPTVSYNSPYTSGSMTITANDAGVSVIKVVVQDNGGSAPNDTVSVSFEVNAYTSINEVPVIPQVVNQVVINSVGQVSLDITGITDGDDGTQTLSAAAVSANPSIAIVDEISITDGTATLLYTPQTGIIGSTTITVTITDDGGSAENDGDKSTDMSFELTTKNPSATGYEWPNDGMSGMPTAGEYVFSAVTFDGGPALKVDMTEKWTYAGVTFVFPVELDLTEIPVVQYEIYSVDMPTWHWNYFWDAFGYDGGINRNIENSTDHMYQVPANQWTTLTFDYRDEGDLNNDLGNQIAIDRIHAFLLNSHGSQPTWPFTNTTGTYYIRNIRFGDKVVGLPAKTAITTLDNIPNQSHYTSSGEHNLVISGISNGNGNTNDVSVTAVSSNSNVITSSQLGTLQSDGTVELTYNVGVVTGNSIVTVTVSAPGATETVKTFRVYTVHSSGESVAVVNVDRDQKFQTVRGLGTFEHSARHLDLYTTELGASAMRLGIISNQWEPVNDNNDPNVLNMEGFDYSAFNWEWISNLKERGVDIFILTSWSPPAWMKRNLSVDHKEQAIEWALTDNILEPYYYEEFAESMEAIVLALKERSGVDLYAIGLQNEPAFNEPYPSAILSPQQFKELIKVVGKRFEEKGIATKLYMPEQVTGIGFYSLAQYLDAIQADPEANEYVDIFACHGYGSDGITAGFPTFTEWNNLWNNAQEGTNKKEMWMTETHIGYTNFTSAMKMAGALHGSLYAGNISLWTNWAFEDMQLTNNIPNSSFYTSMNYFKFIRPGAIRISTESLHADALATGFENPDGTIVFVIINKGTGALAVNLAGNSLAGQYTIYRTTDKENCINAGIFNPANGPLALTANSVTTLVGKISNLTMDDVANLTINKSDPVQTIEVTGIANGEGGLEDLTLEVATSNAALTTNLTVSDINITNGTAVVTFTPSTENMGTATITLTLKDADNNSVFTQFDVVIGNVSDADLATKGVAIYPNPVNNEPLVISVSNDSFNSITILDVMGRVVYTGAIEGSLTQIDVSSFSKGIYLVTIEGQNQIVTKRIMVQ